MTCRCSRQVYNRSSAYRQHVSATDVGMPNSLEHMAIHTVQTCHSRINLHLKGVPPEAIYIFSPHTPY